MLTFLVVIIFCPLALWSKSKKFTRSSLSIHKIVEQNGLLSCEIELNEVESLSIGWPRDIIRIGLVCVLLLIGGLRVWDFYSVNKWFQWNDSFADAVPDGFCISAFWIALPILGWTPWQWGAVMIDEQTLRIPRMRRTLSFDRGSSTRIEVVRGIGGSYFHCAANDGTQSARFYTNAQGMARLYAWSLPEKNDSDVGINL